MTEHELLEIEKRCNAATSEPWVINPPQQMEDEYGNIIKNYCSYPGGIEDKNGDAVCTFGSANSRINMFENDSNKIFIANARTDLPKLVVAYRKQLVAYCEQLKELEHYKRALNDLAERYMVTLEEYAPTPPSASCRENHKKNFIRISLFNTKEAPCQK